MSHLLFAAGDISTPAIFTALIVIAVLVVAFLIFIALVKYYKRCPSNRILVIYGKSGGSERAATCIHGGARFVWPIVEDYDWLSLEPMQISIPLRDALSSENIRVNVPSVFTVATGTTPELMQNAAIRLLGLSTSEIEKQASDIIFGQLRQVIASMKIEDINRDRDMFLANIQNSLEPELRKIGLVLINVNITDITDESGYIKAIGQKAASEAIQKARGDVADNEKMGEIRVADAVREKDVRVAEATKLREIGTREALRDQEVRMAELASEQAVRVAETQRDQQIGEQRASFAKEVEVKNAERDMRVQLADADARAIEGENTSKADVAASLAALKVKQSEAYQLGESKKVEAEAAVIEAGHIAQTKAALAEAKRVEAKRRAELEAPAKAEKAKRIVEAEALAEQRRIEAEGEAAAIYAKLEAKARGQYEMLAKKGEGLQEIIKACGGSEAAFKMLMLEHFDNLVDASAKAISNIKFDKVVVWEGSGKDGQSSTAGWLQNMARTLPPMMQVMKDIGGVELPETLINFTEGETVEAKKAPEAKAASEKKPQ